jgi:hypothetical protein
MTGKLTSIVEGHGEVGAYPVLLRRLLQSAELAASGPWDVVRPVRVPRDRLLNRPGELERALALCRAQFGKHGAVLVAIDADDDCPARLGPELAARVGALIPDAPSAVVVANREFEAWFMAAQDSLRGVRGFVPRPLAGGDPEAPRDAKGCMRERMADGVYSPVPDQAAFAARFDFDLARDNSRSFRKLLSALRHLTQASG